MPSQAEKLAQFAKLHAGDTPLVLVNIWDAGSARTVAAAGAAALATGSASVGGALGLGDGEAVPLDLVLDHAARIIGAVDLPVSIDFEAGYAAREDGLGANIARVIGAGAVGINLEDGYPGGGGQGARPLEEAASRLRAARAAADAALPGFWINARTDLCLNAKPETHDALIADVIARGAAFAAAGASSFFVPGLRDLSLIRQVCEASPLPVNVMAGPEAASFGALAQAGVRRISYGPFPWRAAMATLTSFATRAVNY
ncbi:isocitrate lyase/phosphoenolpyruvate mutase family protein [Hyphomonas sp. WL0036]|uniref:isocitrate lyase/PEP mutase family protein n=1 Tax=Hyphomonas sediminis TaxID=2866160 RepID=UPI001C80BF31|nr:isocitrate lyase/phosphoenolpyruvate mutase family protein [Hyphomonas sediminis]MBY9066851.1 isocitrate lyase/phosphoenolpyruvate mutase family protein [Hyphomonas sediminis]